MGVAAEIVTSEMDISKEMELLKGYEKGRVDAMDNMEKKLDSFGDTKEVRFDVSEDIQDKIKAHLDYWRGRPFEELEQHVLELMAKEAEERR